MNTVFFYFMLIVAMAVWMAIKVGRQSTVMGIVTLLCWPVAVIPLITNWGQRGSDIRLRSFDAHEQTGLVVEGLFVTEQTDFIPNLDFGAKTLERDQANGRRGGFGQLCFGGFAHVRAG